MKLPAMGSHIKYNMRVVYRLLMHKSFQWKENIEKEKSDDELVGPVLCGQGHLVDEPTLCARMIVLIELLYEKAW
jgi:hypothetical protein